ncbi:MAG: dTMP kinase [bacterium]
MPGLFVTFEGGEGSGKSTQVTRLADRLRESGLDPFVTREPGGTPLAEAIRGLLLDRTHQPQPVTEALLMVAARSELVATAVRPALAAGRVVLCDRYGDSTLAYQGGGRGLDAAALADWNRIATGGLVPDLTLLFDVPHELGLARRAGAAGTANRLDLEAASFHARVRTRYLELAAAEPERWIVLDASRAPEVLEAEVWAAVSARLPGRVARP